MICLDNKTGSKLVLESAFWAWHLIGPSRLSPLNWSQTEELNSCIPSAHPLWGCSFLREAQWREKCQQSISRSSQENKQVIGHIWAVTWTIPNLPTIETWLISTRRRHKVEGASSQSFTEKVACWSCSFIGMRVWEGEEWCPAILLSLQPSLQVVACSYIALPDVRESRWRKRISWRRYICLL